MPPRKATPVHRKYRLPFFPERIANLTEHFKGHKNDNHSRRGLLKLVSQRRRLLDYVKGVDHARYQGLITSSGPAPLRLRNRATR